MISKDAIEKIKSCKALQGMSVTDLIGTQRFLDNLAGYMAAQKEDRTQIRASYEAMRKLGGVKGYKLPAHPIDRVIGMSVEDFAVEYGKVITQCSKRPLAERRYIQQLGQQAYNLTVAQYVIDEYPELEDELLNKQKQN